jgi:GTPase SAR1 family protein
VSGFHVPVATSSSLISHSDHEPWPWLRSLGLDRSVLEVWGSVLTGAVDLAIRMGCSPIVLVGADQVTLLLWDLEGAETEHELRKSYLRGASGYLLVADGTRNDTLDKALALQSRAEETIGSVPFLLLLNKSDLEEMWDVDSLELDSLKERDWQITKTSAKTGQGVEEAFLNLAQRVLEIK